MIRSSSAPPSSSGAPHPPDEQSPQPLHCSNIRSSSSAATTTSSFSSFQDALAFLRSVSAAGSGGLRSQSRCMQCMDSITVLWLSHVARFPTPYDVLKLATAVAQRSLMELPPISTTTSSISFVSSLSSQPPASSSVIAATTTLHSTLEFAVYVEKLLRVLFTSTTRPGEQQQQQQQQQQQTTTESILPLLSSFHRAVVMVYVKQLEFKTNTTAHFFVGWTHIVHRLKLWSDAVSAAAGGAATGTALADVSHVYCVVMSSVFRSLVDDDASSAPPDCCCLDGGAQCLLSLARAFEEFVICTLNHSSPLAPVNSTSTVQHVLSLATRMLNKIAQRCLVTPSLRILDHDKCLLETVLPSASRPSRCGMSPSSRLSYGEAAAWVAATMRLDVQRTNSDRRGFCDPLTLNPEASDRDVLAAVDKCLAAQDHAAEEEKAGGGGASSVTILRDRLFVSTALCLCKCLHHWDALPVPTTTTKRQLITTKAPPSVASASSSSSSTITVVAGLWDLLVFAATAKSLTTNVANANATTDENSLPDDILSFLQGVAVRNHETSLAAEMLASRAFLHVAAATAASSPSSAAGVSSSLLKRLQSEEGEEEEVGIAQRQQQSTVIFLRKVIRCVADGVNPRHALFRWYLWEVAQSSSSSSSSSSSTSPSSAARGAPLRFQEAAAVSWQCPTSFVIALAFADVGSASWFLDMALPVVHYFCSYSPWVGLEGSSSSRCDGDTPRLPATSNPLLVASLCRVSQEVVGGLCLEGDLPAARSLAFVPLSLSVFSVLASRWAAPWEGVLTLFAVSRSDTPPLYPPPPPPPTTTPPGIDEGGGVEEEEHPQRALVLLSLEHLRLWLTSRTPKGGGGKTDERDHIVVLRVKSLRSLIALALDATHSSSTTPPIGNNDDMNTRLDFLESSRTFSSSSSSLDAFLLLQQAQESAESEPQSAAVHCQPIIQTEDYYVPYRMTRHQELGRTFAARRQRCMQQSHYCCAAGGGGGRCSKANSDTHRYRWCESGDGGGGGSEGENGKGGVHTSAILLLHLQRKRRDTDDDSAPPAGNLHCMATLQATVTHQLPLWMCCYRALDEEKQQRSSSSSSASESQTTTTFTVTTTASRVPQHVVSSMCEEMKRIFLANRMSLSGAATAAYKQQASSASRESNRTFNKAWWAKRRELEARVGRVVDSMEETDPRGDASSPSVLVPQHTLQWLWLPFPSSVNEEDNDLQTCLAAAGKWLWNELMLLISSSSSSSSAFLNRTHPHALSETWTYHHCLCLANWAAWRFLECGASRGNERRTVVAEECGDVLTEAVRDAIDRKLVQGVACQFVHRLVGSLVARGISLPTLNEALTPSSSAGRVGGWNRLLYLAMSNELHVLPWEGLSMMRGGPGGVSLVRCPLPPPTASSSRRAAVPSQPSSSSSSPETSDHLEVHYVLNPTGDLTETQQRFEESFSKLSALSTLSSSSSTSAAARLRWSGIVGPSQAAHWHHDTNLFRRGGHLQQQNRSRCDVFLYIGHGGGECLVPREVLYDMLPPSRGCNAVVPPPPRFALLMGCCSALLVNSPEHFDPVGMPYAWLHAGAEAVVGCTVHVSDGDIDRFTTALLESFLCISLTANGKSSAALASHEENYDPLRHHQNQQHRSHISSLTAATAATLAHSVRRARCACKLPLLTGCMTVCYANMPVDREAL